MMDAISNTEKQARFRKKEVLKRRADQIFRELILGPGDWKLKIPDEIRASLDKAVELPSGWTDEDYERAEQKLEQLYRERSLAGYDNPSLLTNDVHEGRGGRTEFMTTPDPTKFVRDIKIAIEDTRTLAAHLISALKLSGCNDADRAAALMEAVRFIGRSIASGNKIPKSKATTMCLASIGPQYPRPDWFAEELTSTLAWNIGKDLAHDIGQRLCEFNNEV
ncbi:hypothetical protein [Treponema endosymbiont of Eucomonympha sp.]|uniref:hypothetical protein n=1 Tax=Treponema endosymbiont of Eucomonympha sp. TaxID=1580831 RepID=UPI0007515AB8|nr:hypothetical protein [Treponema endosymbiont of Eucomonympha sp.]